MADTLEYSNVAFPRARFEDELVAELKHFCPSLIEDDGDALVIRHVYIERRMIAAEHLPAGRHARRRSSMR